MDQINVKYQVISFFFIKQAVPQQHLCLQISKQLCATSLII